MHAIFIDSPNWSTPSLPDELDKQDVASIYRLNLSNLLLFLTPYGGAGVFISYYVRQAQPFALCKAHH
jgi:hypothetical protein